MLNNKQKSKTIINFFNLLELISPVNKFFIKSNKKVSLVKFKFDSFGRIKIGGILSIFLIIFFLIEILVFEVAIYYFLCEKVLYPYYFPENIFVVGIFLLVFWLFRLFMDFMIYIDLVFLKRDFHREYPSLIFVLYTAFYIYTFLANILLILISILFIFIFSSYLYYSKRARITYSNWDFIDVGTKDDI